MIERDRVSRLTFVPFLHDGRCALIPVGDRLAVFSGEVLPGEDPLLDTGLRVPLVTAGFRRQSRLVLPGGRLLVSNYVPAEQRSRHPAAVLASLGFRVDGVTTPGGCDGRAVPPTAWVLRAPEDS